jgi:perosamine synthetase
MPIDLTAQPLAIHGGPKAVDQADGDLFRWPIITQEHEQAVLDVLRAGSMSGLDVTRKFEQEYAAWNGVQHALAYPNGTMALMAAMHALGIRRGDEVIVPSLTYWASAMPAYSIGATVVFADVDPDTLCIDPADIERHISKRTKAIMAVHYCGHPCDMDPIMAIARRHNLKIIEDVAHAHGALYKGRMVGTFGEVAGLSMMSAKSFSIGEGGMLLTDSREILERAVAFGNYARHGELLTIEELKANAGVPTGGVKGRLNQMGSAMGRVQLKHYPQRMAAIQAALNRFWDLLEGTPGVRAHRPAKDSGSTMGGWYNPVGLYVPEELNGLALTKFAAAMKAEGITLGGGANAPLHLHPVFNSLDIYGDGKPTRIAFSDRDLRQAKGSLPHTEAAADRVFGIPHFRHDRPAAIQSYAAAFRKVALQADQL